MGQTLGELQDLGCSFTGAPPPSSLEACLVWEGVFRKLEWALEPPGGAGPAPGISNQQVWDGT